MKTLSTAGRILRAIRLRPMTTAQLMERLLLSSRQITAAARALELSGHLQCFSAESDTCSYPSTHWQITAAGAQSSDNGEWANAEQKRPRGAIKPRPRAAGNLRDTDLAAIAIYVVQRMNRDGAGETWALWHDDDGDIYFEVQDNPAAQTASLSPARVIGFYRQGLTLATRVSKRDIFADLQAALAELNARELSGVAA